jgi:hypothetical protein
MKKTRTKGKRINVTESSNEVANSVMEMYVDFIKAADRTVIKSLVKAIINKVGINEVHQLLEITGSLSDNYNDEPFCVGPGPVGNSGEGIKIVPRRRLK